MALTGGQGAIPGSPGSGGSGGDVGVSLASLLNPMLRIAGITTLPGTTPNVDQYGELIPMVNRMLSSYNLNGHIIFNSAINQFSLTTGQKEYTIGPGGELDMERPLYIKVANVILPTSPTIRWPMAVYDDYEWAAVSIQDITGAPPYALYYDGAMDQDTGLGQLSLIFQPPAGYILELYTWQRIKSTFEAIDDLAVFPDGYAEMIVQNGARRLVGMYPLESKLDGAQRAELKEMAAMSLRAVTILNTKAPAIGCDPALNGGQADGNGRPWLSGAF